MNETLLIILNSASTLFMVGVIWFVQLVHYPLFRFVSKKNFSHFEKLHSRYASYVVVFPMLIELVTSILLLKWCPTSIPYYLLLLGFILVVIIWMSTFLLQVPSHARLSAGYDINEIKLLERSNWFRTTAWSLRGILVIILLGLS